MVPWPSGRSRAKMLYSDYCKYAPQTRYPDFDHLKKQMFKLHHPHRQSGYIAKVDYQETMDAKGNPIGKCSIRQDPRP